MSKTIVQGTHLIVFRVANDDWLNPYMIQSLDIPSSEVISSIPFMACRLNSGVNRRRWPMSHLLGGYRAPI